MHSLKTARIERMPASSSTTARSAMHSMAKVTTRATFVALALCILLVATPAALPTKANAADYPQYTVADTAAGGVYSRSTPYAADTPQTPGVGAYPGDVLTVYCGITDGGPAGPYANTSWYYVHDNSRSEPDFWINDHYLHSSNQAGELAPNVQVCPNKSENPLQNLIGQWQDGHLPCTHVLLIGVRGSGDDYLKNSGDVPGFGGTLSPLMHDLMSYYGDGNVTAYGLPYAAVPVLGKNFHDDLHDIITYLGFYNEGYGQSVTMGANELASLVAAQEQACPSQLIDIAGYSQGADVVNQALTEMPSSVRDYINGVVVFGDPQFNGHNQEDRGTYNPSMNGFRADFMGPRPEFEDKVVAKLRSYCDNDDLVCNLSSYSRTRKGHFAYAQTHVSEAAEFLEAQNVLAIPQF